MWKSLMVKIEKPSKIKLNYAYSEVLRTGIKEKDFNELGIVSRLLEKRWQGWFIKFLKKSYLAVDIPKLENW